MGLTVYVYRESNLGDCTNNGVTKRFSRLTLTNVEGQFEPTLDAPGATLIAGNGRGIARIVPDEVAHRWTMMGGNYAATSDSRFSQAVEKIVGGRFYGAVAVHDRVEGVSDAERVTDAVNYLTGNLRRLRKLKAEAEGRGERFYGRIEYDDPQNLKLVAEYLGWDQTRTGNASEVAMRSGLLSRQLNPS